MDHGLEDCCHTWTHLAARIGLPLDMGNSQIIDAAPTTLSEP